MALLGNARRSSLVTSAGSDPFTDLLFNVLLGFILLFFLAILFINTDEDSGKIDIEAEYIITTTWPDGSEDDIDTWIEDPRGEIVWFRNRDGSLVHLDRDDRGMLNDTLKVGGETVSNPLNQEVAAIRGLLSGEYVVNVHYYDSKSGDTVPVAVKLARVNPVYTIAWYGTVELAAKGDERTALRFTIRPDGSISDINQRARRLVPR